MPGTLGERESSRPLFPRLLSLCERSTGDASAQIFWRERPAAWAEKGGVITSPESEERERQAALCADIERLSSEGRKALRLVLTELGATSHQPVRVEVRLRTRGKIRPTVARL
jgi:hypothetical protein